MYAKWLLIFLLKSTLLTKWFYSYWLRSWSPIGRIYGLAILSTCLRMLSYFVLQLSMFIVWWVLFRVCSNYPTSLTPPIRITLFKLAPLFKSIDLLTKDLISSEPRLYPMMLMNWYGNILWTTYAKIYPALIDTLKAGIKGLSFLHRSSTLLPVIRSLMEIIKNFTRRVMVLLSHWSPYT